MKTLMQSNHLCIETFIISKATDRGDRTIVKYRTLSTILHEFEGG